MLAIPSINALHRGTAYREFALRAKAMGLLCALVFLGGLGMQAQSDPLQSMYLNDKLLLNPAYAGARDGLALTAQYRHQWAGVSQAPRTTVLSAHGILKNDRYGLGFTLHDDRLGPIQQTGLRAAYAYRLPLGSGKLALGLNGAITWHRADFSAMDLVDEDDPVFSGSENRWMPNAGFGAYYSLGDRLFASVSIPRLLRGSFQPGSESREGRMYTASGGYCHAFGDHLRLRTMLLYRLPEAAPGQGEVDLAAEFMSTVWVGTGYRSDGAVKAYVQAMLPAGLGIGYAYDLDLGSISPVSSGSHEIFLRYDLPGRGKPSVVSPRGSGHRAF